MLRLLPLLGLCAQTRAQPEALRQAPALPPGWFPVEGAGPAQSEPLTLGFILQQRNTENLREFLGYASDPRSPQYGQYLSREEARAWTAPEASDVSALQSWLLSQELSPKLIGSGLVEVKLTVGAAASLLQTSFFRVWRSGLTGETVLRAASIKLPREVSRALAGITGLYGLPLPKRSRADEGSTRPATPDSLKRLYNISDVPVNAPFVRQAVASLLDQTMNPDDLSAFFVDYLPGALPSEAVVSKFEGDPAVGKGQPEASLDVEYMMGIAPRVSTEFWYFAGRDFCGLIKRWTSALLEAEKPPLVNSLSYGWQGDLDAIGCSSAIVDDIETDLVKLASRGITIIVSSGDAGSGWESPDCIDESLRLQDTAIDGDVAKSFHAWSVPQCCGTAASQGYRAWSFDGQNCTFYTSVAGTVASSGVIAGGDAVVQRQFLLRPSWPASSTAVTAVGATRLTEGSEQAAATAFGSGGGFFSSLQAPEYQQEAVGSYFATMEESALPPKGSYTRGGRATPDVALLGEGFQVIVEGVLSSAFGTSASAPTFAAMVSLLNVARLKAGMAPMGFLNPFLYQNNDAFTDITKGDNKMGYWGPLDYGWQCAGGWDPVTGLGTPVFSRLLEAAMASCMGACSQMRPVHPHDFSRSDDAAPKPEGVPRVVEQVDVGSFLQVSEQQLEGEL